MTATHKSPIFQKLDVRFGDETFPASATIAFEYNEGESPAPARQITVLAGKRGTWTTAFTPHAPLPQGAQVAFRKLSRSNFHSLGAAGAVISST